MIALARAALVSASVAAAGLTLPVAPAAAQTVEYMISQVQRAAPNCRRNPTYGWQGRVSGNREADSRSIPVSFVGCFPTQAECEAWRKTALPFVTGRLIYNECKPR
ncbi:hypothetical protein [Amorphus coralli]|uniref:hypothetical protein n=1 Tax=Amorphus coralli TaxID=340680 RepID=UPI00037277DA|nr:hypothetical protein [Amorphus coralli]